MEHVISEESFQKLKETEFVQCGKTQRTWRYTERVTMGYFPFEYPPGEGGRLKRIPLFSDGARTVIELNCSRPFSFRRRSCAFAGVF